MGTFFFDIWFEEIAWINSIRLKNMNNNMCWNSTSAWLFSLCSPIIRMLFPLFQQFYHILSNLKQTTVVQFIHARKNTIIIFSDMTINLWSLNPGDATMIGTFRNAQCVCTSKCYLHLFLHKSILTETNLPSFRFIWV